MPFYYSTAVRVFRGTTRITSACTTFSLEEARATGLEHLVAAKATLQFPWIQPLPLAAIRQVIERGLKTRQAGRARAKS